MAQETYIVKIDGEPVFETLDSGDWLDYLHDLGVKTDGYRAGWANLIPESMRDAFDPPVVEWYIR